MTWLLSVALGFAAAIPLCCCLSLCVFRQDEIADDLRFFADVEAVVLLIVLLLFAVSRLLA